MKLRFSRVAAFVLGALALSALGGAQVAASQGNHAEYDPVDLSFEPERRVASTGLDPQLAVVAETSRRQGPAAGARLARADGFDVQGSRVRVVVEGGTGVADAVRAHGGSVEARAGRLVEALVPTASLRPLAAAAAVSELRRPFLFRSQAIRNEAVALMNAGRAHVSGNLGAGVKVAIIDGGFGGLAASQARGDLPANVNTQDYCGSLGAPESHGTAVAENVHDVAPAASLYLICITSEVTLANAVAYAKAQGVHIVNHSVGWYNTGRGDGTSAAGLPDALVADARANGILWVNAAGNDAETHWGGQFADGDADDLLDFSGTDELNEFIVGAGRVACVAVKWDSWPTTTEDYDLYIFRSADTSGPVAWSEQVQNGSVAPTEETCFANTTGVTQAFGFAVAKFAASGATPRFDAFVLDVGDIEYPVAAGSLAEPASSPNAVAVGAGCWSDLRRQPFSAMGPTIDNRTKPDILAPDATSSGIYGAAGSCQDGFAGTSGAAPHVAGLAALLKSADPSLTEGQLRASLLDKALDVSTAGPDNAYGAGLAWLPSTAAPALNGSRISFARGTHSARDLWTSDLDGGDPVNVTPGSPYDASFSHWSPDGSQLAIENSWPTIANADGSGARQLDAVGGWPQWSHDGSRVATLSSGRLSMSPAVGGMALDLGNQFGATSGVSWSLDDSKLYGVWGGDVYTVDADGTNKTLVAATAHTEQSIALSPDGTKIAYAAQSGGVGSDLRIYVTDSTMTGTPVELTTDPTRDENWPRWSPDGTTILYTRYLPDCCTKAETWSVGATGMPAPQVITTGTDSEWFPDWQPLVAPTARELPLVQGSPVAGNTLTAFANYGGSAPVAVSYGWQKCNVSGGGCALTGVTSATYQLTAADVGHTLAVAVEASNGAGTSLLLSPATPVVVAAPVPPPPPPPPPPSGGGGGGGGAGPDVTVGLVASNATPAPNEVVEIRASVLNTSPNLAARDLRALIELPAGTTLLGAPAVNTGPGCLGAATLNCFLDWLGPQNTSLVRLSINVGPAGSKTVKLSTSMSVADPNLSNNGAALVLEVKAPAAPAPPVSKPPAARTSFTGTKSANVLRGNAVANVLRGLGGNDRIFGNGGNDRLFGDAGNDWLVGGPGRDVHFGGTGNDTVQARDRTRDTVDCGAGRDLAVVDRVDKVSRNCETVRRR